MRNLPELLLQQAEKNELVVFVGAGVSRNSSVKLDGVELKPDTWSQLLDRIALKLEVAKRVGNDIVPVDDVYVTLTNQGNLLEKAEYLRYVAKQNGLRSSLNYWIDEGVECPRKGGKRIEYQPNDWHQAILNISELGPYVTVTTNSDTLIEKAFGVNYSSGAEKVSGDVGFAAYTYSERNLLKALSDGRKRPIFKLHGSLGKSNDRLILSSSDYHYLEYEGRLMMDVLRSLLMTRTALFVGYSMQDPDINHILSSIFTKHNQVTEPQHFILHEDSPLIKYRRDLLSKWYGVEVIPYKVSKEGGHVAGLEILQEIGRR